MIVVKMGGGKGDLFVGKCLGCDSEIQANRAHDHLHVLPHDHVNAHEGNPTAYVFCPVCHAQTPVVQANYYGDE